MSSFFTNRDGNTLLTRFNTILRDDRVKELEMIVGFLRLSGLYEIDDSIKNLEKVRIIVGINLDKPVFEVLKDKSLGYESNKKVLENFKAEELNDLNSLPYNKKIERGIQLLKNLLSEEKLELRIHKTKKLHAKVYIFLETPLKNYDNSIDYRGSVITGSSNFSVSGLKNNVEINVELRDQNYIKESHNIFEELWIESIKITRDDIADIMKKSYIPQLSPYHLYIKFLMEYFGDRVNLQSEDLPPNFKRLTYQTDAVNQAWDILQKHNGVFLSDVVGLGKTIIAVRIMQKFIANVKEESILIITPPAIKGAWKRTINLFNIHRNHKIMSSATIDRIKDAEKYGLIIVDESHQFKNFNTERFKLLEQISKTPTYKNKKKKIILLSATPLNNRPEDLANQIYLFQDKRASTIPSFINLETFFADKDKKYKQAMKEEDDFKAKSILDTISNEIRENILKPIMVRRTRNNIKNIKSYREDLEKQGIYFPEVNDVMELTYKLNNHLLNLFKKTILTIADYELNNNGDLIEIPKERKKDNAKSLKYYRYRAVENLTPEKQEELRKKQGVQEGFYEKISDSLSTLMKTLLIKRLESSFSAFKSSLKRMYEHLGEFIKMFEENRVIIAPDLHPIEYLIKGESEKLLKKLEENPEKGNVFESKDFVPEYIENLKEDYDKLKGLWNYWKDVEEDPKIDSFKELLDNDLKRYKKIVVFTESTVTAKYLTEKINRDDILLVSSENREEVEIDILENFDANYLENEQKDKYRIIITTETLAEGVNLHRANVIVNYDIPWNSTRLIQRIGRINRIGSPHKEIFIYNYIPTDEAENEIKLADKAFKKIQTFHNTLGSDNQIFSTKEEMKDVEIFENIEDDGDDELYFLEELRNVKENNRALFNELMNKPNKLRCIRDGEMKSLIYMKNGDFQKFYQIKKSNLESISFTKMAFKLKANKDEKNIYEIPDFHFDDVNLAKTEFNKELIQLKQDLSDKKSKTVKNKNDGKAIKRLKVLRKDKSNFTEYEGELFKKITKIIKKGVFKNLSKEIIDATKLLKDKNSKLSTKEIDELSRNIEIISNKYKIIENSRIKQEDFDINIETIVSESFE